MVKSLENGYGLKRIPSKYKFSFTSEIDVRQTHKARHANWMDSFLCVNDVRRTYD